MAVDVDDLEYHYVVSPTLYCKNPLNKPEKRAFEQRTIWCEEIHVPHPNLREEDEDHQDWPPETWTATFGCRSCGFVAQYFAEDVQWNLLRMPGQFQLHNANCFRVQAPCSKEHCPMRLDMYVDMRLPETANDLKALLLTEKFWKGECLRNHPIRPVPENNYRIERAFGPL